MSERRKVNFMEADGFPFDQDTFEHLQASLRQIQLLGYLGTLEGAYILKGCEVTGSPGSEVVADGWIWFDGEMVPLEGGSLDVYIQIHLTQTSELFNNGVTTSSENKYTDEHFEFSTTIGIGAGLGAALAWADIKTLPRLDQLISSDTLHEVGAVGEPDYQGFFDNSGNTVKFIRENILLIGALGRVSFQGFINEASATVASDDLIFTLPVGYRPIVDLYFGVVDLNGDTYQIKIETDGQVRWASGTHVLGYDIPLSCISFIAWQ